MTAIPARLLAAKQELDVLRHLMARRPLTAAEFRRMLELSRATGQALL
jgi:hypothetical protein